MEGRCFLEQRTTITRAPERADYPLPLVAWVFFCTRFFFKLILEFLVVVAKCGFIPQVQTTASIAPTCRFLGWRHQGAILSTNSWPDVYAETNVWNILVPHLIFSL